MPRGMFTSGRSAKAAELLVGIRTIGLGFNEMLLVTLAPIEVILMLTPVKKFPPLL